MGLMPPLSLSPSSSERPACISSHVLKEVDAFLQKMTALVNSILIFLTGLYGKHLEKWMLSLSTYMLLSMITCVVFNLCLINLGIFIV